MQELLVYDFDGTIYHGDSTVDFFFFCFRKHPSLVRYLPSLFIHTMQYALHFLSTKAYKERFFRYLKRVPDIDELVTKFWVSHKKKIYPFFLETLKTNLDQPICIISASPTFLLEGYTKELQNVTLLATEVDKKTGKITGNNCKGKEKVQRFKETFKNASILKFFSDSNSDEPLARMAREAFIVKKGTIYPWEDTFFQKEARKKRITILVLVFFLLILFVGIWFWLVC